MRWTLTESVLKVAIILVSMVICRCVQKRVAQGLGDASHPSCWRGAWDPLGLLVAFWMAFQGVGVGWLRPVNVNPLRFRSPRVGMFLLSITGLFTHGVLAAVAWLFFFIWRVDTYSVVCINLCLAFFGLLPLYPLDGQRLLSAVLPRALALRLDFWALRFGMWPLFFWLLAEFMLPWTGPVVWMLGWVLEMSAMLMQFAP